MAEALSSRAFLPAVSFVTRGRRSALAICLSTISPYSSATCCHEMPVEKTTLGYAGTSLGNLRSASSRAFIGPESKVIRTIPTRTRQSRWERPTIWRMLHNPAYAGHAFYGKTELRPRRRITRRLRQRGLCSRDSSFRERPRQEWIEIPVPALVSEATFALAQEQFEKI